MQYSKRPEENTRSLGTGATDSCELPNRCWDLNLGSLQEHQLVLLTEEPSPAHEEFMFKELQEMNGLWNENTRLSSEIILSVGGIYFLLESFSSWSAHFPDPYRTYCVCIAEEEIMTQIGGMVAREHADRKGRD